MSAGRFDSDPRLAASAAPAGENDPPLLAPLTALRRHLALLGALLAAATLWLRTPSYRAVAMLLVVEPRLGGGGVDFNLTPIRSYVALLTSPALCAPCS